MTTYLEDPEPNRCNLITCLSSVRIQCSQTTQFCVAYIQSVGSANSDIVASTTHLGLLLRHDTMFEHWGHDIICSTQASLVENSTTYFNWSVIMPWTINVQDAYSEGLSNGSTKVWGAYSETNVYCCTCFTKNTTEIYRKERDIQEHSTHRLVVVLPPLLGDLILEKCLLCRTSPLPFLILFSLTIRPPTLTLFILFS